MSGWNPETDASFAAELERGLPDMPEERECRAREGSGVVVFETSRLFGGDSCPSRPVDDGGHR